MKCPKCGSIDTKKPSVMDPKWEVGAQRCNACGYQDDWGFFTDEPGLQEMAWQTKINKARREALEEALKVCENQVIKVSYIYLDEYRRGQHRGASDCVEMIRRLIDPDRIMKQVRALHGDEQ